MERKLYLYRKYYNIIRCNFLKKKILKSRIGECSNEEMLKKIISNKGVEYFAKHLLKINRCEDIPTRTFLLAFLINKFPAYVDDNKECISLAKMVVNYFLDKKIIPFKFRQYLLSFNFLFNRWKGNDIATTPKNLTEYYVSLSTQMKALSLLPSPSEDEKNVIIIIGGIMNDISETLREVYNVSVSSIISSDEKLKEYHALDPKKEIEKRVRESLEKAFWDKMHEEISKEIFDSVDISISEIKGYLHSFLPGNIDEISSGLGNDLSLRDRLGNILYFITLADSEENEKENISFVNSINSLQDNEMIIPVLKYSYKKISAILVIKSFFHGMK